MCTSDDLKSLGIFYYHTPYKCEEDVFSKITSDDPDQIREGIEKCVGYRLRDGVSFVHRIEKKPWCHLQVLQVRDGAIEIPYLPKENTILIPLISGIQSVFILPTPTPTPSPTPTPHPDPDGDGVLTYIENKLGTNPSQWNDWKNLDFLREVVSKYGGDNLLKRAEAIEMILHDNRLIKWCHPGAYESPEKTLKRGCGLCASLALLFYDLMTYNFSHDKVDKVHIAGGDVRTTSGEIAGHAWLVFEENGEWYQISTSIGREGEVIGPYPNVCKIFKHYANCSNCQEVISMGYLKIIPGEDMSTSRSEYITLISCPSD